MLSSSPSFTFVGVLLLHLFHAHYMITNPALEHAAQQAAQQVAGDRWPIFEAAGGNGNQVVFEQPNHDENMEVDEEPAEMDPRQQAEPMVQPVNAPVPIQPGLNNLMRPLTNPYM